MYFTTIISYNEVFTTVFEQSSHKLCDKANIAWDKIQYLMKNGDNFSLRDLSTIKPVQMLSSDRNQSVSVKKKIDADVETLVLVPEKQFGSWTLVAAIR